MKVVIQKVVNASVTVENRVISSINKGLLVLVGISVTDTITDINRMTKKVVGLRVFEDLDESTSIGKYSGKPWAKSLRDYRELEILCVSQFTLYANINKGTKPDFHLAQKPELANPLYQEFLKQLSVELGPERVKDGQFGAMMQVSLVNDGPVTIVWET